MLSRAKTLGSALCALQVPALEREATMNTTNRSCGTKAGCDHGTPADVCVTGVYVALTE